jgi:hypothetical protein
MPQAEAALQREQLLLLKPEIGPFTTNQATSHHEHENGKLEIVAFADSVLVVILSIQRPDCYLAGR